MGSRTVKIDPNCELTEFVGRYQPDSDADIMPHVSSITIACDLYVGE
jgi:lactam utilization protein B